MTMDPVVDEVEGEVLQDEVEPVGATDCERCAYLDRRVKAHERRSAAMAQDIVNRERDSRGDLRKIARLESELEKQRVDDPEWGTAKTIFLRWVDWSGRNARTTKFGDKRAKAVLAALKRYDVDFILVAVEAGVKAANNDKREAERLALIATLEKAIRMVDGDEELPEVDPAAALRAFYAERRKGSVVWDDLSVILRDEVNIERFHAIGVRLGLAA